MSIRLLHVIPTLDRGGAEKQLTLLAGGLPRDRFDVHVCTLTRTGPLLRALEAAGIHVHPIDKSWKVDPAAYLRLKRLIARLAPDVVHTWLFAANSYGRQAALASGVRHLVAGERCADHWKVWHELAIDRYLARRTRRIVVNSPGVRDFYVQRGLPSDKFAVIPNGIESPLPPPAFTRGELLDRLGLPAEAKLIGAVGRLWPQKRIKDLIWSMHLLDEMRGNVHLLVVGDGPQRWHLERYNRLTRMTHVVHFLGWRDDVPSLLPQFDVLWLASGYEGLPNCVMEAMAAGIPVVATDIPGNRELVVPQQTGFLTPVGDRGKLGRWANVLLDDPDLARRMGLAGQQRIAEHFSVDRMVDRHVEMYDALVAG